MSLPRVFVWLQEYSVLASSRSRVGLPVLVYRRPTHTGVVYDDNIFHPACMTRQYDV
jgi:hypothetical protein